MIPSPLERELARLEELDAFELDAAMRRVRHAMQQRQSRLGISLGLFLDLRLHEQLGCTCSAEYVRERLGMSERSARELIRVTQAVQGKSPVLAAAFARGELSPLRTFALLPVVRSWNAAAWVKRAGEVTLRRLADEVAWAAEQADLATELYSAMPPPAGQNLGLDADNRPMCAHDRLADRADHPLSDDDRQMRARDRLANQAVDHRAADDRPMCAHDRLTAQTANALRDEFWGIAGRIHVTFVDLCNRTTLCAWHHLRAVHGGLARATGHAPDAIDWEPGLRADRPPLLRLRGDRYRQEQPRSAASIAPED
jgi:hypothetical protein